MPPFFLPYQTRWIQDPSPKRLIEKSRQIGISLATAFDLVARTGVKTGRCDAWVSSRDELQAQLFAADCARWAFTLHAPCGEMSERVLDRELRISAHVLPFDNGRSIYSLSSSPDAQAGKRGHRVFDEFALNPANRQLFGVGFPGHIWGGGMDVISTHRGNGNFFNQLVNEIKYQGNPKHFSLHTVTIHDAVEQGLLERLKPKWRQANPDDDRLNWSNDDFLQSLRDGCPDQETWQQEFLCQPGDDQAAFLSYDLIASCLYPPGEAWEWSFNPQSAIRNPQSSFFIGVDIGRFRDLTVIWVAEKLGDVLNTRKIICLEKQTFEAQEGVLYPLLAMPSLRRACIDQTGLGCQFVERARKQFNRYRVEGLTFTADLKEKLAYKLRCAFEDRTIRIPDDRFLVADLRSIRKTVTTSGNVRFEGERGQNSHADRFWAACLALEAAATASEPNRIFAQVI
jgi:phage FluMu gp28-like protein